MTHTRRDLLRSSAAGLLSISSLGHHRHAFSQGTPSASPAGAGESLLVLAHAALALDPAPQWLAIMDEAPFLAAHIEGSIRLGLDNLLMADTSPEAVDAWSDEMIVMLSERGISADAPLVVYDDGTLFAARGWWQLAYMGFPLPRVLDGGLAAWNGAGGPIVADDPGPRPLEVPQVDGVRFRKEMLATKDDILASLGDPNLFIVDARSAGEYGDGHIPGAVNVPYTDNAIMKDANVYLPVDVLRERYEALGMAEGKRAVTYCSTGIRGSVASFALMVAGFTDVALYPGSWNEWSSDPDAPVE